VIVDYRVSLASVGTLQGRPRRSSKIWDQDQGRILVVNCPCIVYYVEFRNCNSILSDQVLSQLY
jgi:hypothetical protein